MGAICLNGVRQGEVGSKDRRYLSNDRILSGPLILTRVSVDYHNGTWKLYRRSKNPAIELANRLLNHRSAPLLTYRSSGRSEWRMTNDVGIHINDGEILEIVFDPPNPHALHSFFFTVTDQQLAQVYEAIQRYGEFVLTSEKPIERMENQDDKSEATDDSNQ